MAPLGRCPQLLVVREEGGQATTEYVLLMAVVLSFYLMIAKGIGRIGVAQKLMSPITVQFASAYQYGKIPSRADSASGDLLRPLSNSKFRVFLNPKAN
ncbi:MAG: hypothetical protein ABIQ95_06050 [Bdellovibrionia bacterium]